MAGTGATKAAPTATAMVYFLNMRISSGQERSTHRGNAAGVSDVDQRKTGGARLLNAATVRGLNTWSACGGFVKMEKSGGNAWAPAGAAPEIFSKLTHLSHSFEWASCSFAGGSLPRWEIACA